ncbi:MAG: hypothetical protein V3W41_22405 [Planctomycetota bacterium]
MSLKNCINLKKAAGEVDANRADEMLALFDDLERDARLTMSQAAARSYADSEVRRIVAEQAADNKRLALLQIVATERIGRDLEGFRGANGKENMPRAAEALFDRDDLAEGISNLDSRRKAVLGRLHTQMANELRFFSRDILGRQMKKAELDNMAREIFGEKTGDEAAGQMARAWETAAEDARQRFNAGGGRIPKRQDWGMPQSHDSMRVRKASLAEWKGFIRPRLDTAKMLDEQTGLPFTVKQLDEALDAVYETIRTDGWSKVRPSGATRGRSLANRRVDPRFLVFRSADDWLTYNARFGDRDPWSTMVSHLDHMSRDIAALEILGPNPEATVRWLGDTITKRAAEIDAARGGDKAMSRARTAVNSMDHMWAAYKGTTQSPVNARVARGFQSARSTLASAQLGSATLSAVSDIAFQAMTARFNGLRATGVMRNILGLMADSDARVAAIRGGLIADSYAGNALSAHRMVGEVAGHEFFRRLSDGVMRASGLEGWTQFGRWAMGREFQGSIADFRGLAFDALDPAFQNTLTRYGLDGGNWDKIRAAEPSTFKGVPFLEPEDIALAPHLEVGESDALATKYLEMIQTEMEFAVPTESLKARAAINQAARPGTFMGEMVRSVGMYKNFPITVLFTHIQRAVNQIRRHGDWRYLGGLMMSTTMMGAMALQLKQIAGGRDPRPMTSTEFWAAAGMQGGGIGIFGDLLFADQNRFGGGFAQSLAGPVVGLGEDVLKLTVGNIQQAASGKKTNVTPELARFLKRYTPGTTLWYTRLATERALWDQLDTMINPSYAARARRRRERGALRDYGQKYWWRPGQTLPGRAPDLTRALEARP